MEKKIFAEALTIILLASMVLGVMPTQAAMSIEISPAKGPVDTEVTVTGKILTYNGEYEILFDADGDGTPETSLATGTADGYDVSETIKIPHAYQGAKRIRLVDLSASPQQEADAFFTVETKFELSVDKSEYYEGGPFTITANVTGGKKEWATTPQLDLQIRVKNPDGDIPAALTIESTDISENALNKGNFLVDFVLGDVAAEAKELVIHGDYVAYLDWKTTETTYPDEQMEVVTASFTVRLTDASEYERTDTIYIKAFVESGVTVDKWQLVDPDGDITEYDITNVEGEDWTAVLTWPSEKDSELGVYTVKLIDTNGDEYKKQTFLLKKATIDVTFVASQFKYDDNLIKTENEEVERTYTVTAAFKTTYPDGSDVSLVDITTGFTVAIYANTTKIDEVTLDPLTDYSVDKWIVEWKIPKDAPLGIGYSINVTVNSISDQYGNVGPGDYASTADQIEPFKVVPATLKVTEISLIYPGADVQIERTRVAKASIKVEYPDGTVFAAEDLVWLNITVDNPVGDDYEASLSADAYSSAVGLWVAEWMVPYDADTAITGYTFKVAADSVEDKYGNAGPASTVSCTDAFGVKVTTIKVSDLSVDKEIYETDEEVTITFEAAYVSGVEVTSEDATGDIKIYKGGTEVATVTAEYDPTVGKFVGTWIVPDGATTGLYNATIEIDAVTDEANNIGPKAKAWANFNVTRIGMTTVISRIEDLDERITTLETALSDLKSTIETLQTAVQALKVEAITAAIGAVEDEVTALRSDIEAAKQAATSAGDVASQAKSAADSAKQAAEGAASAADEAKAAAQASQAAAQGIATAVYGAIILSLIAALASIVAVITLQRKVA